MDGITVRMSENRHIRIQIQNYDKFQLQSGKTGSPHPRTHHKICERHKYVELKQMLQTLYQYQLYGWGKYNKLQFLCVCFHLMQSLMLVCFIVLQQNSRIPQWNFEWQCKLQFTTQQKPF